MKIKVALIGLGKVGSGFDCGKLSDSPRSHVGAILSLSGFELVGVQDSSLAQQKMFLRDWGKSAHVVSSLDDLLAATRYDVVVIASSTISHAKILQKVISKKPRLIFCEKPFCGSLREAMRVHALAKKAKIPIVVNYHRSWDKRFQKVESLIRRHGNPVKVIVTYRKGLLNYGSHAVHLLIRLLGPIGKVSTQKPLASRVRELINIDTSDSFRLQFKNGTEAIFIGIDGADYELFDFDFYFKRAKLQLIFGGQEFQLQSAVPNIYYQGYTNLMRKEFAWESGLSPGGLLPAYEEIRKILTKGQTNISSGSALAIEVHRVLHQVREGSS